MTVPELQAMVRTIQDWPQRGVQFRDICPLLYDPVAFDSLLQHLEEIVGGIPCDRIAGVDARGFILGGAMARKLQKPFVPVRKKGKLPGQTVSQTYALEYGQAAIEIQSDACSAGDEIVVIDDLIATGGTLLASISLFEKLNAHVSAVVALIDLPELKGSKALEDRGYVPHTLFSF